jgi:4-amino-4-deoxy-L-arabinose transferase-like glycosyltransferase
VSLTGALAHKAERDAAPSLALCVAILAGLTVIRIIGLHLSRVDLFFDESQYWAWSRELAFGYFSKPPLLAFIIAATERVCGAGEACIRSASPVLYLLTALVSYAIAARLYDRRVAFWTALMVALAPGVVFSTRIISTDVPLLLFWSIALYAYIRTLPDRSGKAEPAQSSWAVMLGLALGFGMLAKYAMIYFVLGVAIHALLDARARALLRGPWPWIALGLAVVVLLPNIWWNLDNGFVTLRHTGDNIQGGGARFNIGHGLEFIASQFAVAGPIVFAVLLCLFARIRRLESADRLLVAFAIPSLALVAINGFITHANANWAAPSLVSAIIVATAWLVRRRSFGLIGASLAIGAVVQITALIGDAYADRVTLPIAHDPYARTMGWRALGEEAKKRADAAGARTIVADERDSESSLIYYTRDSGRPVLAWPTKPHPDHQFDITRRFTAAAQEPVLLITRCPATGRLERHFSEVTPLPRIDITTGPSSQRIFFAFRLAGRRGDIGVLGACQ